MDREKALKVFELLVEDHKILRLLFPGNGKSRDEKTIGSLQEAYFDNLAKIEELLPDKRIRDKANKAFYEIKEEGKITFGAFLRKYKELTQKEKEEKPKAVDVITNAVMEFFADDIIAAKKEFTHSTALIGRIDILLLTKENKLVSVEIKSKKDNLNRLFRQLYEATKFFDRSYVALDEKHYKRYIKEFSKTFPRVGILLFKDGKIVEKQSAWDNEKPNLYPLLWASEVKDMAIAYGAKRKEIQREDQAREYLEERVACAKIRRKAKEIFIKRFAKMGYD